MKMKEELTVSQTTAQADNSITEDYNHALDAFPVDSADKVAGDMPGTAPFGRQPRRKSRKMAGRIIQLSVLAVLVYIIYALVRIFMPGGSGIEQLHLIPHDAAIILETGDPAGDWLRLSSSGPWQELCKAESFASVARSAEVLDSIINGNRTLTKIAGKRDVMISLHKTGAKDWDALIVVDLKKLSRIRLLRSQLENIIQIAGMRTSAGSADGIDIIHVHDDQGTLALAFVENQLVASYTPQLVSMAITQRNQPQIALQESFVEASRFVSGKGICRVYINYSMIPDFTTIYLSSPNEYIRMLSNSMDFAGLYLAANKDRIEIKGRTYMLERSDPYVNALLGSGSHRMKAHNIVTARAALYANIGMDNVQAFVNRMESAYAAGDSVAYGAYRSAREKIEKYFGISLQENFLSWMDGEFAIVQSEPGLIGREPETLLLIRATNIKYARSNKELLEKRIRRRTPIRINSVEYKGFPVNYVEMKGFFRLFFGKIFDRFETPYYTYIDNYVVMSNTSTAILSFIEDYTQGNLMKNDPVFKNALSESDNNSTLFCYIDTGRFYSQLQDMLDGPTRKDIQANENVFLSFPAWHFQIKSDKSKTSLNFTMDYREYEPRPLIETEPDTDQDKEQSQKEVMKELKRFYVEKFEGNVLREYYDNGTLQSESETKNGMRHGRYRAFSPEGKLIVRGKYSSGEPRGTWKYYTPEGKLEKKVRQS